MASLEGKIALVTGASRGIGRGVAIELAREGASVVIAARTKSRSESVRIDGDGLEVAGSLEEVAETIVSEGGKVLPVPCDLSDVEQIQALATKTHKTFGRI